MFEMIVGVALPIALILVMTGVGMSLEWKDFVRVGQYPKAFFVGVLCQLVLLPVLAVGVISITGMEGALAMGVLVIALCPGGVTSNLFTYLAKGDVGLSVSLTTIIGLVTPFTIPFVAGWGLQWLGLEDNFQIPVLKTIIQLLIVTVIPVLIGMAIRGKVRRHALWIESLVRKVSTAVLGLVILALVVDLGMQKMMTYAIDAGVACVLLNLGGMLLGAGIAYVTRLGREQKTCILLEVGVQNGTIALLITATLLGSEPMSVAPSIYSLWMMVSAGVVVYYLKRKKAPSCAV